MAYLFDTDHCIYLMNGWNNPKSNLTPQERNTVEYFKRIENDVIYMCEASVGELVYGVERSQKKEYNLKKLKALMGMGIWEEYRRSKPPPYHSCDCR